jgi:hypothetical protein
VLLINPVAVPPVTHTDALFADQSQSFSDNAMALFGSISSTELLGRARDRGCRISSRITAFDFALSAKTSEWFKRASICLALFYARRALHALLAFMETCGGAARRVRR